jgi:hypothetical protein
MKQASPGFSMASNLINNPDQINKSFGPPPPPVETKNQPSLSSQRPGMQFTTENSRQDINMARGIMMREKGVDLQNQYSNFQSNQSPSPPQQQPQQSSQSQNNYSSLPPTNNGVRNEMKGPQTIDLDNILSGLKTKTIDIHEPLISYNEDDSMISISSLKDLQNNNPPKKSRGRRKSDKMVVTLDI